MDFDHPPKQRRGLALVSPERRREIASAGGKNVPKAKRAFSRDTKLASAAGQKSKRRPVEKPPEAEQPVKRPFLPSVPDDSEDLLLIHLQASGRDYVVVQHKSRFNLERAIQEAWFALTVSTPRTPVRWKVEVKNASGACLMVLRNKL